MALSVVTLKDGAKIEVDQHGPSGKKRERVGKGLPPECRWSPSRAPTWPGTRATSSRPLPECAGTFLWQDVRDGVRQRRELIELVET